MKVYEIILESGNDVFKLLIPSSTKNEAIKKTRGNGEVIKIKEVTAIYPIKLDTVIQLLQQKFGESEITIISRILQEYENII